jgi:hypothetical protein
MPTTAKKSKSRQAFEEVFEEQTRRFSAFDLLGLSSNTTISPAQKSSHAATAWLKESSKPSEPNQDKDRSLSIDTDSQGKVLIPDCHTSELGSDGQVGMLPPDSHRQDHRPDSEAEDLSIDSQRGALGSDPSEYQTVSSKSLNQTVKSNLYQTGAKLRHDRLAQATQQLAIEILLSPIQWQVWLALKDAEATGLTTSYRRIAREVQCTVDGVKKAVTVIQKEGGIVRKETVRTAEEQGFRVELNYNVTFRRGTLNEAKGVLKRGLNSGHTREGQVQALGLDGLRMSVGIKNNYIRQTDIAQLLRISPPEWKIREQTLIQIAEALPDMTAIEFRLSLALLVDQAKRAKDPIRNPNAWMKAAFEKNERPLVTEREIEARFELSSPRRDAQKPRLEAEQGSQDLELLRRYLTCEPHERAEIDRMAEEKCVPLLKVVSDDKRPGIIEEARLEALRDFFAKRP